jgi:predicted transcriptional regulator
MDGWRNFCRGLEDSAVSKLPEIIRRVETWPEEAQEQAIASLELIEEEMRHPYELSQEDRRSIERGLADADAGRFVSEQEVAALFERFRER